MINQGYKPQNEPISRSRRKSNLNDTHEEEPLESSTVDWSKAIAYILACVFTIVSIVIANTFKVKNPIPKNKYIDDYIFNWDLFFICEFASSFIVAFFYALGKIIYNQKLIISAIRDLKK